MHSVMFILPALTSEYTNQVGGNGSFSITNESVCYCSQLIKKKSEDRGTLRSQFLKAQGVTKVLFPSKRAN